MPSSPIAVGSNDVGGLASVDSQAAQDGVKYLGPNGGLYATPQPPVIVTGPRMTADEAAAYDAEQARVALQQSRVSAWAGFDLLAGAIVSAHDE